jgi:hypothetical protein
LLACHLNRLAKLVLLHLQPFGTFGMAHHDAVESALDVAALELLAETCDFLLRQHRLAVWQRLLRQRFKRLGHRRQQGCIDFLLAPALRLHLTGLLPNRCYCLRLELEFLAEHFILAFSQIVLLGVHFRESLQRFHSFCRIDLGGGCCVPGATFFCAQVVISGEAFQRLGVLHFLLIALHFHFVDLALIDQIGQLVTLRHSLNRVASGQSDV